MDLRIRNLRRSHPRVELLEGRALLAAGALDTSFGGTGQVISPLPVQASSSGVAVQPDLKTVVVGIDAYNLVLFRCNVDGSLDSTFGSDGEVLLATNSRVDPFAVHNAPIAIQPDGKIVVVTNTTTIRDAPPPAR
jgi:uncharacterized delta-60 repeat protein